eukprot:2105576-Rhodomonas_salina.1
MDGLPRKLRKENFEVCPASCCMDTKAIKNPYPPASTHLNVSPLTYYSRSHTIASRDLSRDLGE